MAEFDDLFDGTASSELTLDHYSRGWLFKYASSPTFLLAIAICLLSLVTRTLSGQNANPVRIDSRARPVPAVPYWIPLLGHAPNMALNAVGFLESLRTRYRKGIFSLNFGGTRHNVMYSPGLATALLNQTATNADSEQVARRLMNVVFGFPRSELDKYDAAFPALMTCYKHLSTEPSLGGMVEQTAQKLRESINDLATGNASLVDQMPWERTGGATMASDTNGDNVVEASLLPLIRDFAAHAANPTIMGSNFLMNFPDFFEHLWALDRGFLLMATGLPRWFPIPSLTRAHIARRRVLDSLYTFHEAMEKEAKGGDAGAEWQDLNDVGTLVKARMPLYRKYGFSIRARAAAELALNWAANANSNMLIFWMLNRIYADRVLLEMIREEIAPYVHAIQPPQDLAFAEPPRFATFDVEGLCTRCPLLKSCYVECLRLDTASWSFKVVKQDFVLQSREKDDPGWLLRKGDYAHAAHDLHNTDPNYFENPMVFKPDRHIKYEGDEKQGAVDMGSIRSYGGGSSMCKGRAFAFKECMMFTAAIVAMWEIQPAGGGEWKMPRHRKATGVYSSSDDTRVWIKRRKLSGAGQR